MSKPWFRTPFDQELVRRDDRLDLLKRQLATAFERSLNRDDKAPDVA